MKQELQSLASKIGELEMDKEEHTLVIDTVKPLPGDRVCFRLIGGVLMERNVQEVLPALQSNLEGVRKFPFVINCVISFYL
jgi:prefoldin subunit 2